ncbi:MAG: OmpA family protein [Bacteroidales bacterium]|jgi:outer membrane protein OmpA-like peptidoglycan-associated protein|nr:OmpA family protein [Bacteroidales bacterium]
MKVLLKLLGIFALFCFVATQAFASNDRKLWKEAEKSLALGEYEAAISNYKMIYEKNAENYNMAFKIGYSYLHTEKLEDVELAIEYLSEAHPHISNNYKDKFKEQDAPPETEYYLGVAYQLKADYTQAIEYFKAYKAFDNRNLKTLTDNLIDREIQSCEFSQSNPPEKYKVEIYNFDVEIPEGQYLRCPVVSGNDSVFVYTLGTQNVFPPDLNTDRDLYYLPVDDIFYSTWENNGWSEPTKITEDLNLGGFTMPTSLSYDGKTLLLVHDDNDNGNIYKSSFENGKWTNAEKLNKNINSRKWESHATIAKTNDKLYFTSARKGGKGDLDIYVSELTGEGNWGEPKTIGDNLNTEFHEETPFLIDNGNQLYFASEGQGNMGGFDMFVSVFDSVENEWAKPKNLGFPYNTVGNDLAYIVTFQDRFIYCPQNSNKRRDGVSASDCFSLHMPYEDKLVSLRGQIFIPELNNEIPADLVIAAIDKETGDTVQVVEPSEDGSFIIEDLTVGEVTLVAMSSEYIKNQTIEVVVPEDFSDIEYPLDIYLNASELALRTDEPSEAEVAFVIKHVLFDFDKYNIKQEYEQNLNNLAEFMKEHDDFIIEIQGHTDHYGANSYNQWLGRMRAQSLKSYLTQKGVKADNLSIVSFGEEKPIAKQIDTDKSRHFNRRAMITVKSDIEAVQVEVEEIPVPDQYKL